MAFGSSTTADEIVRGIDLSGTQVVVTGANSGIGAETVKVLARAGADVVLCCRDVRSGEEVAQTIREEQNPKGEGQTRATGKIAVHRLDLADLASVKETGEKLRSELDRLDMLILNAGVMACPLARTTDGFEMQFGTNHLGHMAFTMELLEKLKATGTAERPARVVAVSSEGHRLGSISLTDPNFNQRWYNAWMAYAQSKLANILFAKELAARMEDEKAHVSAFSVHPGVIMTNLQRHMGILSGIFFFVKPFMKTIPQGAATTVYAATSADVFKANGKYLVDCKVANTTKAGMDADLGKKLWEVSEKIIQEAYAKRGL